MATSPHSFGRRPTVSKRPQSAVFAPEHQRRLALFRAFIAIITIASASWLYVAYPRLVAKHNPIAQEPASVEMSPAPVDLSPIRAFPNIRIVYYDVPGIDTASIIAYMQTHGVPDAHDHVIGEGSTAWRISWNWIDSSSPCETQTARVEFSGIVTLPRFESFDQMDVAHQADWNRYLNALIVHESGHIRHAYQHVSDVAAVLHGRSCAEAGAAAQTVIKSLGDYDAVYDAQTRHGALQGIVHPST